MHVRVCMCVCACVCACVCLDVHILLSSQVGVFQFIPQVTDFVNEKTYAFQQWHTSVISQADDTEHSQGLNEMIKSSFNTVLIASQCIIKQYNMLQSCMVHSGM